MKLIKYEWKKLWKNASVLKVILFLILISSAIFWAELQKEQEWIPEYLSIHKEVDNMSPKEAEEWLILQQQSLDMMEMDKESYRTEKALVKIGEELKTINDYDSYREEIQSRYERSQTFAIFSDSKMNHESYMKQIAKTYEELHIKAPMQLQPYMGLEKIFDFYPGQLLTVVLLLYLVSVVFLQEEKSGKSEFAETMIYGKRRIFIAKVITVYGSLVLYMLAALLIQLAFYRVLLGQISLSAAIQSVKNMHAVPYAWTIGQYIGMSVLLKMLAFLILVAVTVLFAKRLQSEIFVGAGIVGILGISIWTSEVLYGDGIQALLRHWNVWSLLKGKTLINSYDLLRFGKVNIEVFWGIPILLFLAFGLLIFAERSKRERIRSAPVKKRKKEKKTGCHGVFYYEMKKMWVHQGGILLFLVCIILQGSIIQRYEEYFGTDEYYYHAYIERFGERITEETEEKIRQEEVRLTELEEELMKEDPYRAQMLIKQLECRGGLQKYAERAAALENSDKEKILLKDKQYTLLFGFTEVSKMMVVLLLMSLAFLVPSVFQKEKETRMETLQKTAKYGGRELWNRKIAVLFTYVLPLVMIFGSLSLQKVLSKYHLNVKAPINCLERYWAFSADWPIIVFFLIGVLLQGVMVCAVVIVFSFCAKRGKNQYVMTGIVLGGVVVPVLLSSLISSRLPKILHDCLYIFTGFWRLPVIMGGVLIVAAVVLVIREERDV